VRGALDTAVQIGRDAIIADVFPHYRSGLDAYAHWAQALDEIVLRRAPDIMGLWYNAHVWAERRQMAVAFLQEIPERVPDAVGQALDDAIAQYSIVSDHLNAICEL